MIRTRQNIKNAIKAYDLDLGIVVNGSELWLIWEDLNDPPSFGTLYHGDEIIDLIALYAFGELSSREGKRIPPRTYRTALEVFRLIHTRTEPVYRKKALEDLSGTVRFGRGKQKKGRR